MKRLEEGDIVEVVGWESLGPFEYLGHEIRKGEFTHERVVHLRYLFGPQAGQYMAMIDHNILRVKEPKND